MSHTAHLSLDTGRRLAQGLALTHFAISDFGHGIARRREEAASSVQELAIRLREARRDQAAALAEAAAERQARIDIAAENRVLGRALSDAQRELAVLQAAYRDLAARR